MKVAVVNPPGPVLKAGTRWASKIKERGLRYNPFPFFHGYALAVLRDAGHEVAHIDAVALELEREEFLERLAVFSPDVVVLETTITSYGYDVETFKDVDATTVVVGMHATTRPEQCIEDYDYVCIGEYEYSLLELVDHLAGTRKGFPDGVATKKNLHPERRPLIEDLDELPWPARELMPIERYNEPVARGFNVVLVAGRGCPYRCTFCQVLTYYGKANIRYRSPADIVDEMVFLWDEYKPDELYFDDDTFTANPAVVREICAEIKRRNVTMTWGCMGTLHVTDELLATMADAGCKLFKFGVETIDPAVLSCVDKTVSKEDAVRVTETCRRLGIRSHPTFMVGLPESTKQSDEEMIDFAIKLRPTTLQFSVATPFPGTPFYDQAKKEGWLTEKEEKDLGGMKAAVSYPHYPRADIEDTLGRGWQKWNRHIILHQPATIYHHLYGVVRREGIKRLPYIIKVGIKNVLYG